MNVAQRTVTTTDGLSLAVFERGETTSPTILLVHGYPDTHAVWDPVADVLARQFHVVSYDVRGSGQSDAPTSLSGYLLQQLAADVKEVARSTASGRPVHLVGHDWGSIQSWEAVTRAAREPYEDEAEVEAFKSYTSISGPSLDHVGAWIRGRLTRPTTSNLKALIRQGFRSWYVLAFQTPGITPFLWRHTPIANGFRRFLELSEGVTVSDEWPADSLRADGANGVSLYRANIGSRFRHPSPHTTKVPVQVLVPTQDRFATPALLDDTQQWVPNLWRRRVPAGHWVQRSHPDHTARWITEFVEHVEGADPAPSLDRSRVVAEGVSPRNEIVVVTGAGSGIGRATACAFADRGAALAVADINEEAARRTVALCEALGSRAQAYVVDVSDAAAMESFAKAVESDLGVPDVVVNNAGIGMAGPMLDTSVEDWAAVLGVNLWGVIHGSRLFATMMRNRGEGGHIVNTSSAAAFAPSKALPAYATSKSAVLMLSECLRAELASDGIGVSAICPGIVDTGITSSTRFVGVTAAEQLHRQTHAKRLYQRRNFTPDRVATAILKAVDRNEPVVPVAIEAKAMRFASRLSPRLMRRLAALDVTP